MWKEVKEKASGGVAQQILCAWTHGVPPKPREPRYEILIHWPDGTWTDADEEEIPEEEMPDYWMAISRP
jgi:hypothetical protein